jgi:hypothetical protein
MGIRYCAIFSAILLFFGIALVAQDTADAEDADGENTSFFFPIHRLWQAAQGGAIRWQPDWPLAIPPDSFDPAANGNARRVIVTVTAVSDGPSEAENAENAAEANPELPTLSVDSEPTESAPLSVEYTVRLGPDGRLMAFPFLLNGSFYQASVLYDRRGAVETMTLAVSHGESIEIAILQIDDQTDENRPLTARIKTGDTYYFASFRWTAGTCVELWTDETGLPLEIFTDERIFHYDSMRNTTLINDGTSEVSARYNGSGVRYWTTAGNELSFQRDETGLIIRLSGVQKTVPEDAAGEPPVNYSYEYQFDQNGNWTERREIRWLEMKGYLVPAQGTLVTRFIDYAPVLGR